MSTLKPNNPTNMEKELPVAKPGNEPDIQIIKFLLGEDVLDGVWFGDTPEGKPKFWWRKNLRELKDELETLPAQQVAKPVFHKEDVKVLHRGTYQGEREWGLVLPEEMEVTPSEIHEAVVSKLREKGILK